MNILELYSGIGGMHLALNESHVEGNVVAAVDINTVANLVYNFNFPNTPLLNKNIQSLTSKFINKLNVDTILMSPPCQPFTRNGLKGDESDPRACSFSHLLHILPDLNIKYILIENVKGFETSVMRDKLLQTLKSCQFAFQEFILSPTQIGISNTRHRYYCIAKKLPMQFSFPTGEMMYTLPNEEATNIKLYPLSHIIESDVVEKHLIPDAVLLKRATLLDICTPTCSRSCCFTKAYGKYVEGTGSVYTPKTRQDIDQVYAELQALRSDPTWPSNADMYVQCARTLQLRFFTSREVARLMCFPESFIFPPDVTDNQKYRLLGNSINVLVVSKLIEILVKN